MNNLKKILLLITSGVILIVLLGFWALNSPITSPPNRLWQYIFWKFPYTEYAVLSNNNLRDRLDFVIAGDEKYDLYRDEPYKNIVALLYLEDNPIILDEAPRIINSTLKSIFPKKSVSLHLMAKLPIDKALTINDIAHYSSEKESKDTKVMHITVTTQSMSNILGIKNRPIEAGGVAINSRSMAVRYFALPPGITGFDQAVGFARDDYEKFGMVFISYSKQEKNLLFKHVLTHELGHILGLRHTSNENCVMYPKLRIYPTGHVITEFCEEELERLMENKFIPNVRTGKYLEDYYTRNSDF